MSKKGSLRQTYNKKTKANTKVYDLNQRAFQALNNLAIVCATFEHAGANLEVEISEETCSLLTYVLLWKSLRKLYSTRNACKVN